MICIIFATIAGKKIRISWKFVLENIKTEVANYLRISSDDMASACWSRSNLNVRESWDSLSWPWLREEYWNKGVDTCCKPKKKRI